MKAFQKPLSISQEKYYLQKYQEGDSQAKNILIEHNLRLVAHVVKKYQGTGEDTDDLISIGTIGLIKAVTTFNPQKASRLSTYAARCIENELLMYFRAKKKHSKEVSLYEPIGTDKEGNWAPFSFLCQNINMYYENPVCYRDLQIHSDVMEKGFGIYQYINTYKAPRNGKTFFYRYDKTDEIHILAYVKTDLFQEADIGKLNKAFVEFWKQYITTKEEKKEIYF